MPFWPAFDSNEAALDALVRAIARAGFTPGDDVSISLDIASSEFYRDGAYHLALEGRVLDSDAMSAMLIDWLDRYPIVSIEDPLTEHDAAGLTRFTKAVGHRVQIVGDDFLVTDAARLRRAAATRRLCRLRRRGRRRCRRSCQPSRRRGPPREPRPPHPSRSHGQSRRRLRARGQRP